MRLIAALTGLAAALAASAALAGTAVQLTPAPTAGASITLGDLFAGAGRASAVVVARNGADGAVLDAAVVQRTARLNGLDWDNAAGLRRVVVRGGGAAATAGAAARSVEVLTYARSLAAGELVGPSDLVFARVPAAPMDAVSDSDRAIGLSARRPLRAGAVVSARDLSAPQVVKSGEAVEVAYQLGGISLTLTGKALGAGGVGDSVSVLNPASKKTIQAVVSGPGRAIVGPQADQLKSARFDPLRTASR